MWCVFHLARAAHFYIVQVPKMEPSTLLDVLSAPSHVAEEHGDCGNITSAAPAEPRPGDANHSSKPEWEKVESTTHAGYWYYLNIVTGATQWEEPADYISSSLLQSETNAQPDPKPDFSEINQLDSNSTSVTVLVENTGTSKRTTNLRERCVSDADRLSESQGEEEEEEEEQEEEEEGNEEDKTSHTEKRDREDSGSLTDASTDVEEVEESRCSSSLQPQAKSNHTISDVCVLGTEVCADESTEQEPTDCHRPYSYSCELPSIRTDTDNSSGTSTSSSGTSTSSSAVHSRPEMARQTSQSFDFGANFDFVANVDSLSLNSQVKNERDNKGGQHGNGFDSKIDSNVDYSQRRSSLIAFYTKHDPSKITNVHMLLTK
jgi:hypothetical protein